MHSLRILFATSRARVNETAMLRRALEVWLATGAVPVAHMVADPDETNDEIATPSDVRALPPAA